RQDRQRRHRDADARDEDERREGGEDLDHRVTGHHVAGKSDGVADRAHEVGDDLDQRQHRTERKRRRGDPEEAEEPCPVLDEADERDGQEDRDRHEGGDRDVARRRQRAGDQPEEVREDDEAEEREDVGEELQPVLAGDVLDHLVDEAVAELGHRLEPRGDDRPAAGAKHEEREDRQERDRHPERRVRGRVPVDRTLAEQRLYLELVHRMERQAVAVLFRRHVYSPSSLAGRPACFPSWISRAVRSMVFTPATKPSNVNSTRKRGSVPSRTSSPYPMPKPIPSPATSSITIRQPWLAAEKCSSPRGVRAWSFLAAASFSSSAFRRSGSGSPDMERPPRSVAR